MKPTADEIDRQKVILYTWVSKAFYKRIKSFKVPEKYVEAAKDIASQGNGFRFADGVLSWD
jgi:hypothetical protein